MGAQKLEKIGMIAGNGIYPATFARAARAAGVKTLVATAFKGETEASLEDVVETMQWLRVGQLSKMISFFQREGVEQAVMVGQIAPKNLFDLRPDLRTMKLLARLKEKNAESIFGGIADELANEGIKLLPATTFLQDLLPSVGSICGPALGKNAQKDAEFGFVIAKEMSRLNIGQTVVVKNGTVLAVEAFEGTNEAIRRGGKMGKGKATMVKVSKPNQDLRFDVPVVGEITIETAVEAGISTVAVEAERTLLLGKEELFALCKKKGVSLVAVESEHEDDCII